MVSTAPCPCPYCGMALDDHECVGPSHRRPRDGAFSLCWYCGGLGVFTTGPLGQPRLREPTTVEMANLHGDPRGWAALQAARRARAGHTHVSAAIAAARREARS